MDDARPRPRPRPRPRWRTAAGPDPVAAPRDARDEEDDVGDAPRYSNEVDDAGPFSDDVLAADDRPDVSEPPTADESADLRDRAPWWILHGEKVEGFALSNRSRRREHDRSGLFENYATFWDYIDVDPQSVLPTVRAANIAQDRQYDALERLRSPHPLRLMVNVVAAAAAALVIVNGPAAHRLVAFAACLLFGAWFTKMVSSFAISSRVTATSAAAAAVACVVASTVPTIHATRWHNVLVGLAFAAGGLFVAAMGLVSRAWRVERNHWARPDVAMVAALLEFSDRVQFASEPQHRRHAVAALDRAATRFELGWQRVNRTGVDVTDRQLRGWAGRIRAETRELQRWCAFDTPSTFALLMQTYKLILAIVNRDSLDEQEDAWVRHGSWRRPPTSTLARLWVRSRQSGRWARQCLLAGFIAIAALLLLANTVWSAVPTFIGTHVSRDLGSALNFDPTVRVFVAGISLSMFAVAGRAFSRRH